MKHEMRSNVKFATKWYKLSVFFSYISMLLRNYNVHVTSNFSPKKWKKVTNENCVEPRTLKKICECLGSWRFLRDYILNSVSALITHEEKQKWVDLGRLDPQSKFDM